MKLRVRCTFEIDVDVPDDEDYDAIFDIEDNHCPGTGIVGAALERVMADHEETRTCWACALGGKCQIVDGGGVD